MPTFTDANRRPLTTPSSAVRQGSRTWKIFFRTEVPSGSDQTGLETTTVTADSVVVTASGDLVGHSGVGNGINVPVFCYAKGVWESCHLCP